MDCADAGTQGKGLRSIATSDAQETGSSLGLPL